MYKVTTRTQDITTSRTISPDTSGGWIAINTGADTVYINGYEMMPGQGLDFTHLSPEVVWNNEITIQIPNSSTGKVRLTRLYYTKL